MQSPSQQPSESVEDAWCGDETTLRLVRETSKGIACKLAAAMSITDQDSTAIASNLRQLKFTLKRILSRDRQ